MMSPCRFCPYGLWFGQKHGRFMAGFKNIFISLGYYLESERIRNAQVVGSIPTVGSTSNPLKPHEYPNVLNRKAVPTYLL
jgi:hypothetical protein